MLAGYEFECPICEFHPENGNDLEEHLEVKHGWDKRDARYESDKGRKQESLI